MGPSLATMLRSGANRITVSEALGRAIACARLVRGSRAAAASVLRGAFCCPVHVHGNHPTPASRFVSDVGELNWSARITSDRRGHITHSRAVDPASASPYLLAPLGELATTMLHVGLRAFYRNLAASPSAPSVAACVALPRLHRATCLGSSGSFCRPLQENSLCNVAICPAHVIYGATIRIARSAEARRFKTYPRRLSRKRPERAEICLTE